MNVIDPSVAGSVIQIGDTKDRNEDLKGLMKEWRDYARQPFQEGRYAGGMYVSASPLEALADVLRYGKLTGEHRKFAAEEKANRDEIRRAKEAYMAALLRGDAGALNLLPGESVLGAYRTQAEADAAAKSIPGSRVVTQNAPLQ